MDQFERVTDHTQKGIEFCEKYSHFIKERAKVELEYANSLKKLVKNYLPRKKDEEISFTVIKSFNDSLNEVNDIARQHDLLAEQLKQKITDEIAKLIAELKIERKKHIDEAKRLEAQLQQQHRILDQSKKKYERAFQEQVRADETFKNADANLNLSRAEVEKTKNISFQRAQQCSDCKSGYAHTLEQTNAFQRDYYNKLLPQVFQTMQEMDEKRVVKIQESIKLMSDVEKNIQPIVNTCLDMIVQASSRVDHVEDSRRVIDKFKSGFFPPEDIVFDDLSNEDTKLGGSSTKINREATLKSNSSGGGSASKTKKKEKGLGRLFGGRNKKKYASRALTDTTSYRSTKPTEPEREDFGHLAPQQQKKQLKEKIKQIKHQITKECAEREGMVKMQEVYQGNPKLGDASALNGKLEDNRRKIDSLEQEMSKYEAYLSVAEGNGTPIMARRSSVGSYQSTNSGDTPASSVNGGTPNTLNVSQNAVSNQRQASSMYSIHSTHNQFYDDQLEALDDSTAMVDSFDNDSFDEADAEPGLHIAIGKATALYQFEATTAGSLNMMPNEVFDVVENDNGDGWTRIRRSTGEEGFVPTSYIQLH